MVLKYIHKVILYQLIAHVGIVTPSCVFSFVIFDCVLDFIMGCTQQNKRVIRRAGTVIQR